MSSIMKQCPICLDGYTQPKFLNCHHTFCLECIRLTATRNVIKCPLCQEEMRLPSPLNKLTTNFHLEDVDSELLEGWHQISGEFVFNWGKKHQKHSFHGVTLKLELSKGKTGDSGEVLAMDIQLAESRKYFVTSCKIEYNITLMNQKKGSISTRQKGMLQLTDNGSARIPLIRWKDATDKYKGYLIRETLYCQIFHVNLKLKASNVTLVDYNITN